MRYIELYRDRRFPTSMRIMTLGLLAWGEHRPFTKRELAQACGIEPAIIARQVNQLVSQALLRIIQVPHHGGVGHPANGFSLTAKGRSLLTLFRGQVDSPVIRKQRATYPKFRAHFRVINLPMLACVEAVSLGCNTPRELEQSLKISYIQARQLPRRAEAQGLIVTKRGGYKSTVLGSQLLRLATAI